MTVAVEQNYVAFLDILGFSEMVQQDFDGGDQVYLRKLFKVHQKVVGLISSDPTYSIAQFSDSVVIARVFVAKEFKRFCKHIGNYQRLLLKEGLLCRGGIATGKHFHNNGFTFSQGLISAYRMEHALARFPRIVVDPELITLLSETVDLSFLAQEDDGIRFVNFADVPARQVDGLVKNIKACYESRIESRAASVREKAAWLAAFSDHYLGTMLSRPRFE